MKIELLEQDERLSRYDFVENSGECNETSNLRDVLNKLFIIPVVRYPMKYCYGIVHWLCVANVN